MSTTRLKRYRHFPTPPDAQALVMLLRLTTIDFEIRYERGVNYGRAGHEPDRLEVWIWAADYAYVQRLEAALTREQALALAANMLPDDQLRSIMASAAPRPPDTQAVASSIGSQHFGFPITPTYSNPSPATPTAIKRWFPALLLVAALTAFVFYWLK
jgi:hypothetical protein